MAVVLHGTGDPTPPFCHPGWLRGLLPFPPPGYSAESSRENPASLEIPFCHSSSALLFVLPVEELVFKSHSSYSNWLIANRLAEFCLWCVFYHKEYGYPSTVGPEREKHLELAKTEKICGAETSVLCWLLAGSLCMSPVLVRQTQRALSICVLFNIGYFS